MPPVLQDGTLLSIGEAANHLSKAIRYMERKSMYLYYSPYYYLSVTHVKLASRLIIGLIMIIIIIIFIYTALF